MEGSAVPSSAHRLLERQALCRVSLARMVGVLTNSRAQVSGHTGGEGRWEAHGKFQKHDEFPGEL